MKKKVLSKVFLGLSAATTVVAPVAAIVSCGESDSSKEIRVGVRPEEEALYTSAAAQFEKATGWHIKFIYVSDQQNNYRTWGKTNMPNVALADAGTMKVGAEAGWFKTLNLKDLLENKSFMIDNTKLSDTKYNETQLNLNDTDLNMNMLSSARINDTDYRALPVVFGPHLLYMWTKFESSNLFDGTKELKWFVPKKSGGTEEVKFSGKTHDTNPLVKAGHTIGDGVDDSNDIYKNSLTDVQQFIFDAADNRELGINKGIVASSLDSTDPQDRVVATGEFGEKQRLASLGTTLSQAYNAKVGAVTADPGFDFVGVAQGYSSLKPNTASNYVNGLLDDSKWVTGWKATSWDPKSNTINGTGSTDSTPTDLLATMYNGFFGYFDANKTLGTAKGFGASQEGGTAEAFARQSVFMLEGAKWQQQTINDKITGIKKYTPSDITALSLPFFESGIDGYALTDNVSGDKEVAAKQWLRFLMQPQVQADIASNKTLAIRRDGQKIQQTQNGTIFDKAVINGGKVGAEGSLGATNLINTDYEVIKASTQNYYDKYNDAMILRDWNGFTSGTPKVMTFDEVTKHIIDMAQAIKADEEVVG